MANFDVHITGVPAADVPDLEVVCQEACVQAIEDYYGTSGDGSGSSDSEFDPSSAGGY